MKKLLISLTLFITYSQTVHAQFSGGLGTSGNPFQVATAAQLNDVRDYMSFHFIQTADIDLSSYATDEGWDPIGTSTTPFTGSYNGNGFTISNLAISRSSTNYVGLFGYLVDGSSLSSVALSSVNVTGAIYTGALVGYNLGAVSTSSVSGQVTGTSYTGGLIGANYSPSGTVATSYSTATVSGSVSVTGGLIGWNRGTVTNSYATGSVSGASTVGGFIGINSSGTITNSYATGTVSGTSYLGGFSGGSGEEATSANYWDTETSGQGTSRVGTGLSSSAMKQESNFSGWDFTATWAIESGSAISYPYLQANAESPKPGLITVPFAGGSGTVADPFQVATAAELNSVRDYLNFHFIQTADIDLGVSPYNTGEGWEPIGTSIGASVVPFTGSFDGGGYTISNLFISRSSEHYIGLFGYTGSGSSLSSVALRDVTVTGNQNTGGLVGYNQAAISLSSVSGQVTGTNYTGGLIGGTPTIDVGVVTTSYSTATVSGTNFVGGLIGYNRNSGVITNSYATGAVSGTSVVGGFVGSNSYGTIMNSYAAGAVSGTDYLGGFAGNSNNGTASGNYWDTEASGQSTSGVGAGLTALAMREQSSFSGWDFSGTWAIVSGSALSYPYLKGNVENPKPGLMAPSFAMGSGTVGDPYQVATAADLDNVRNYLDAHFVQTANIDLGVSPYNTGEGWEPIGINVDPFTGSFNGAGFTISNLFISRSSTDYIGLFGYTETGSSLSSMTLTSVDVTGVQQTGGLAGRNKGNIASSSVSGQVTGTLYTGGLVGYNEATVSSSSVSGQVTGSSYTGGLVGHNHDGTTVSTSYSTVTVAGSDDYIGGLIGRNRGAVTNTYASGAVTGASNVGGLVGNNSSGTIANSYAAGAVTGTSDFGGFTGIDAGSGSGNYWDTETSGQSTSALATGLTSFAMKQQASFSGWDFSTDWAIITGITLSYPYLQTNAESPRPGLEEFFAGGSGTEADPYQVATVVHLDNVRNYLDAHFLQTADIDLGVSPYNTGEGWEPIGTSAASFTGSYNGAGFSISNLFIDRSTTAYVGLFGYTGTGSSLGSITLAGVAVTGDHTTGGLVGLNQGKISASSVSGQVSSNSYTGGLIGSHSIDTVSTSYSTAAVSSGSSLVGGLIAHSRGVVIDSYATGAVSGTSLVGGLVGGQYEGTITNSYAAGAVTGTSDVGGFMGIHSAGTSSGNYWDTETSGQDTSVVGTGLTTIQLKQQASFSGWDFSTDWAILSGDSLSYPYLQANTQSPKPGSIAVPFVNGSGTEVDPYQVSTAAELDGVRNFLGAHFLQTADIDLGVSPYNTGSGWEPIGTSAASFTGAYNGAGFSISNLFIYRSTTAYVGLFGYTGTGSSLGSITLAGVAVTGDHTTGGLVGLNQGKISASSVSGQVSSNSYTGGLIGSHSIDTVSTSYSTAAVSSGSSLVGGLIAHSRGVVIDSYATGAVSGTSLVGGLVGGQYEGTITNSYAAGAVTGTSDVGGFMGIHSAGTSSGNYWDTETSGQSASPVGTGLSSFAMKQQASFSGWDFTTTWAIDEGNEYPDFQEDYTNSLTITGDEGWRMLGSPVSSGSFSMILEPLWTQGFAGADASHGTPNIYVWSESAQSFVAVTSMDESLINGYGFIIYVYSDDDNDGSPEGFPKSVANSGSQHYGEVDHSLSYTNTGSSSNDGWNLMGNPYGSSIHWDSETGWGKENLDNTIYVWSDSAGAYLTWNGLTGSLDDGLIDAWQGFWIKANADAPKITFTDSVRHRGRKRLKQAPTPQIKVSLDGETLSSKAVVMFSSEAEQGQDPYDAYKLNSMNTEFLSLGTSWGEQVMDIQALPLAFEPEELDLEIEGSDLNGSFRLSWEASSIPEGWQVELMDRELGTRTSLLEGSEYIFDFETRAKQPEGDGEEDPKVPVPPGSLVPEAQKTKVESVEPEQEAHALLVPASPIPQARKAKAGATRFALYLAPAFTVSGEGEEELPTEVELSQNYPNPFNPSTTINFAVPEQARVRLEVFDVLGRKVSELLNEPKNAGRYSINFDAARLSSGVYLYRLQVGSSVRIKKMTLIK